MDVKGRILLVCLSINLALAWENLPQLPTGRRSQYFLQEADGAYKYGFDTGDNFFAKQSGDAQNQVEGHFKYNLNGGKSVDVRYTSGVQGYVPSGLDEVQSNLGSLGARVPASSVSAPYPPAGSPYSSDNSANTDGSYSFSYDTGDSSRQESADAQGNVRGQYAYRNEAGNHDLSYVAGSATGFLPTGGSLSVPNGLGGGAGGAGGAPSRSGYGGGGFSGGSQPGASFNTGADDGSYSFSYNTGDSSREESADSQNNVRGRYSYTNSAGNHDLSYVAGAQTGFVATGGSLAVPNGLTGKTVTPLPGLGSAGGYPGAGAGAGAGAGSGSPFSAGGSGAPNADGSYSFSYNTGDSSREESADSQNYVKGRYSYTNSAGNHDLSYVAGADTGFVATGGSLATPNGLAGKNAGAAPSPYSGGSGFGLNPRTGGPVSTSGSGVPNADGSYSFSYNTGDSSRQESADSQNNVQGRYSYTNAAGNHDLSYVAGAQTGFVATGGSLATPNGLTGKTVTPLPGSYGGSGGPGAYSGGAGGAGGAAGGSSTLNADGSYSFSYNTGDSSREESADSQNNVKGRYSYTNSAGNHDLSYVAGSQTGFLPTGGSLATPNGLTGKSQTPYSGGIGAGGSGPGVAGGAGSSGAQNADGSYSFSYNTGDSAREESADSQNNVRGRYSYTNSAGNHDLSYIAGAQTGFVATGGSLATPNGLAGKAAAGYSYGGGSSSYGHSPSLNNEYLPPSKGHSKPTSYSLGNVLVQTYLPPSSGVKFGYIFDTKN